MSASKANSLVRVQGIAQNYEWGKKGLSSAVAQLQQAGLGAVIDHEKPYAELWLGTHPSGPAKVDPQGDGKLVLLKDFMQGKELPFLLKVLSVRTALSIQAHPDSALAAKLFKERPNVYKDPYHKPELANALTPFEALCAFRPLRQIYDHALDFPEFRSALTEEIFVKLEVAAKERAVDDDRNDEHAKQVLKAVFAQMMTLSEESLKKNLGDMLTRLEKAGVKPSIPISELTPLEKEAELTTNAHDDSHVTPLEVAPLMLRLSQQYPGDVGIFAPLYLNAFALSPGQSIFLGPNNPHAYLSGDCVECMAASDNVVRAGLTPKLRDTQVLIDMLTYESNTCDRAILPATKPANAPTNSIQYAPPKEFNEFQLVQTKVKKEERVTLMPLKGNSILLVVNGHIHVTIPGSNTLTASKGQSILVPDAAQLQIEGVEQTLLVQCAANLQ